MNTTWVYWHRSVFIFISKLYFCSFNSESCCCRSTQFAWWLDTDVDILSLLLSFSFHLIMVKRRKCIIMHSILMLTTKWIFLFFSSFRFALLKLLHLACSKPQRPTVRKWRWLLCVQMRDGVFLFTVTILPFYRSIYSITFYTIHSITICRLSLSTNNWIVPNVFQDFRQTHRKWHRFTNFEAYICVKELSSTLTQRI